MAEGSVLRPRAMMGNAYAQRRKLFFYGFNRKTNYKYGKPVVRMYRERSTFCHGSYHDASLHFEVSNTWCRYLFYLRTTNESADQRTFISSYGLIPTHRIVWDPNDKVSFKGLNSQLFFLSDYRHLPKMKTGLALFSAISASHTLGCRQ